MRWLASSLGAVPLLLVVAAEGHETGRSHVDLPWGFDLDLQSLGGLIVLGVVVVGAMIGLGILAKRMRD